MDSVGPAKRLLPGLGVGVVTFVVAAPIAFALFAMTLIVAEVVMIPLATLDNAVITALIASWAAWRLPGDGMRTDLNIVVVRNLAWALAPVAGTLAASSLLIEVPTLRGVIFAYSVVTATVLALRHRSAEPSARRRLVHTAGWLGGAGVATAAVIFVASLFGMTGA